MTAVSPPKGHHRCPRRGCDAIVPDRLFACRQDWHALPFEVRRVVLATSSLHLLHSRRRWAVGQARKAWGEVA